MKKKLLITASTFPRWEGDTEPRFILDYAKSMQKYYDVTVLAPSTPKAKEKEILEGVKVIRYRYFFFRKMETLCYPGAIVPRIKEKKIRAILVPFLFIGLWLKLLKIRKNYDVIHAHWLIPQGIIQSLFDIPYVVTGHGGDVTSLNFGIIKLLKKRCIKRAGAVTAVSVPFADAIKELVPEQNVTVISMGCNINEFGCQYAQKNFFNQEDKKVILFVGRLAEKKGVSFLISSMQCIDNAVLIIVGKGPLEEKLKKQASEMKNEIQFLGPKTHLELRSIYASADVVAVPSITAKDGDKEGFGLVILEAMASGKPVVASRSGGIVDIVHDGENGFLVKEKDSKQLAEKINLLLSNKDIYDKCAKNALMTAKQYDYEIIAEQYAGLINNVLQKGKEYA